MRLKKLKTYQAIEFIRGGGVAGFIKSKSLSTTFDMSNNKELPSLEMEILPGLGVVRIRTETDCKLVSMSNVEYAVELDAKLVENKPRQKEKNL